MEGADGDADGDIPFVIAAPSSVQELQGMLAGRTPGAASTILSRIRACTAVALAPDNRAKLQARASAIADAQNRCQSLRAQESGGMGFARL